MKITINQKTLNEVLTKCNTISNNNVNLNVAKAVLIQAQENKIVITATNLEIMAEFELNCNVEQKGQICVNTKILLNIIKKLNKSEITITELENRWIEIVQGNTNYKIVGLDPDDFPAIDEKADKDLCQIDTNDLTKAINKAIIIKPYDKFERKMHITSALFKFVKEKLIVQSTDGNRINISEIKLDHNLFGDFLFDKENLQVLNKILLNTNTVNFTVTKKFLIMKNQTETLTNKIKQTVYLSIVEGEFPDVNNILTIFNDTDILSFHFKKQDLINCIEKATPYISKDYKGIVLDFTKNQLKFTFTNPEIGEVDCGSLIVDFNKEEESVIFNAKMLIEGINSVDGQNINVFYKGNESPILLKIDDSYQYLIMPMRV